MMKTEQQLREALEACQRAQRRADERYKDSRCPFWSGLDGAGKDYSAHCCKAECNCDELLRWALGLPGPMQFNPADPSLPEKVQRLQRGENIISREPGHSMEPLIASRQPVVIHPAQWAEVAKGDIVLCRVRGHYYTHKVLAVNSGRGVLIGNNHGRVNGWTKQVYGKVTEVLPMDYREDRP